ncbi:MAG: hypothetical protein ACI9TH_002665 [Kiritimatiellia bacterium]|jgi:hypothetical protein
MDVETFIDDEGILTEPRQKMQSEVSAKYGRRAGAQQLQTTQAETLTGDSLSAGSAT